MALPFEKQAPDVSLLSNELVRRLNEDTRRIKNLEQRIERIETRMQTMEGGVLNQMNDLKIGLERIGQKIGMISDRLNIMETEIMRVNKELGKAALKSDVKRIETFIDVVNPITSKFVTRDELDRVLEDEKIKRKA